jgi:hypothetical protein
MDHEDDFGVEVGNEPYWVEYGYESIEVEQKPKPLLSEYNVMGVGYDVIILVAMYMLAVSFIYRKLIELSRIIKEESKLHKFFKHMEELETTVPIIIAIIIGFWIWDSIAILAGYSYMELPFAICMSIVVGAMSGQANKMLHDLVDKINRRFIKKDSCDSPKKDEESEN